MTIVFSHHGNTIGEVTLDGTDELDAQVFAATSMRYPIGAVVYAAEIVGAEGRVYNYEDAYRTVTSWSIVRP